MIVFSETLYSTFGIETSGDREGSIMTKKKKKEKRRRWKKREKNGISSSVIKKEKNECCVFGILFSVLVGDIKKNEWKKRTYVIKKMSKKNE